MTDVEGAERRKGHPTKEVNIKDFSVFYTETILQKWFFKMVLLIKFIYLFFGITSQTCGILIPQPGIKPVSPTVEMQILNHWTTREVPKIVFKGLVYISHCSDGPVD